MIAARRYLVTLALLLAGTFLTRAAGIPNNAAANLVLGQTLFTTNASPSPATSGGLSTPTGVAVDPVSGKVFISDQGNNRVLRYASQAALTNGAAPDLVIGQVNFSASAANQNGGTTPSQTSLSAPGAVFVDTAGNLWISDTGNRRVLMFGNAANLSAVPANADRVLGQTDFTSANLYPAFGFSIYIPAGLCVDPAGVLWVVDTGNHRVLGFKNAATLANGAFADRVLGQTNFTDNLAGTLQNKFFNPAGVSANASQIWVADSGNNRVLMFQNYPSINGAPASLVLGQTTYITSTPATSPTGLTQPTAVAVSGTSVWVADSSNNRILRYDDTANLANGGAALGVVGQATFLTGSSGLSAQKLSLFNNQISVDAAGNLWVADRLNNRALRFSNSPTPTTPTTAVVAPPIAPTVTITTKNNFTTTHSSLTLRGTAGPAGGISRVSYNLNDQGYLRAKGTTSWKIKIDLPVGRNKIVVASVATDGTVSLTKKIFVVRE